MSGPGMHHFQQPWAQLQPPQPSISTPSAIAVEFPVRPTTDEVRTIFITGLPEDVKERELHNLLRWLPGFEASQINSKGDLPMGFALFSTAQHAVAAKAALQDLVFDAETKTTLHTEMAKKNLFIKRGVGADFSSFDQSKRIRTGGEYAQSGYPSPPFHPQPASLWPTSGYMAPPVLYAPYGGYPVTQVAVPAPVPVPVPTVYASVQNMKDNPPCNTLFIGNLGDSVIEEELRGLFSIQPGYKQMKVLRNERNTVCFIEFDDVASATGVHIKLQGAVLPSTDRTGIRIQYPFVNFINACGIFNLFNLKLKDEIEFTALTPLKHGEAIRVGSSLTIMEIALSSTTMDGWDLNSPNFLKTSLILVDSNSTIIVEYMARML